jgi:hypothetical protein
MLLYVKVGHSKLVEMHGALQIFIDPHPSPIGTFLYFILATGLKLRSIFRTVTFRRVQLKIYFELQYFIPLLKSDK